MAGGGESEPGGLSGRHNHNYDADADADAASQDSSHFPLEPVSGAALYDVEVARRQALGRRGALPTGCRELDDHVLAQGGFERGAVVGVSAEAVEMGLLMGLQTIAHNLVAADRAARPPLRAAIITPLAAPALLPQLLDVFQAQAQAQAQTGPAPAGLGPGVDDMAAAKRCLQHVTLSRVLDVHGLYDVLRELRLPPGHPAGAEASPDSIRGRPGGEAGSWDAPAPGQASDPASGQASEPAPTPEQLPTAQGRPPKRVRTEVMDSEDEGDLLSSSSPLSSPPPSSDPPIVSSPGRASDQEAAEQAMAEQAATRLGAVAQSPGEKSREEQEAEREAYSASPTLLQQPPAIQQGDDGPPRGIPDIILVTHMSTMLSNLFTSRDKSTAHTTLQHMSMYLRSLSRTDGPLILVLNSTSASGPGTTGATMTTMAEPRPGRPPGSSTGTRPLDPTLRSIFNAPPPPHLGYPQQHRHGASHQNKPAFGLTFTQLLDLHILCTRVPRTRLDAAAGGGGLTRHAWAVEVLLDEDGLWDATGDDERRGWRANREQRWGAVDIRNGVRIVDAFD